MSESRYVYFNIEAGIFVFTHDKKSNKKYLKLPYEELMKLSKRNISSVKHHINKSGLNESFFYFSNQMITSLSIPEQSDTIKNIYSKPNGIWISHGISWLDYISRFEGPNKYNLFTYTYKIDVFATVKVITDKESLFAFIKKYKKKPEDMRLYDIIDWPKVKADFTGLIITPHLGSKIWRDNYESFFIHGLESAQDFFSDLLGPKWKNNSLLLAEWYRGWAPGCASGVIWDIGAIASFNLVKTTNYKKYLN